MECSLDGRNCRFQSYRNVLTWNAGNAPRASSTGYRKDVEAHQKSLHKPGRCQTRIVRGGHGESERKACETFVQVTLKSPVPRSGRRQSPIRRDRRAESGAIQEASPATEAEAEKNDGAGNNSPPNFRGSACETAFERAGHGLLRQVGFCSAAQGHLAG
jgi:hypothetical protein